MVLAKNTGKDAAAKSIDDARGGGANRGWLGLFDEGNAAVSVLLMGSVGINALSLRVVVTVLPSAVVQFGGLAFFAWATTVAVLGAIWGAAFAASLAALCGLKAAYRISLVLFPLGSIACAAAPDMSVFLIGRFLQGLGGGLLTALGYATIRRVFAEDLRTRAIVLVSGIWGFGAFCGPLLGGVLAGWGHWRWAFWVDVPLAAAVALSAEYALSKSAEPQAGGSLLIGTALGRLALLGASVLVVAVAGVPGSVLSSAIGLAVGAALLVVLLRIERVAGGDTARFRLLPTGAYRPGSVLGAVSLAMALMVGTTTAVLYVPYVETEIGGYSPIIGGYLTAILSLAWTAAAFVTGSAGRRGAELSILCGPVLVSLGMLLTGWALRSALLSAVALGLALVGGGIGIAWAHLGNLMMTHARDTEHDVSSTFITTNQMIAQAFASALAGMIANLGGFADAAHGPTEVVGAVSWLFFSFAAIAAAALPAAMVAVRLSAPRQESPIGR